jgi:hypothetical protein
MKTISVSLTILILLMICCSTKRGEIEANKAELARQCFSSGTTQSCVKYGRFLLKNPAKDLKAGEAEREELRQMISDHKDTPEIIGIYGAYTAKLGGLYADHGDVIKAVELVEDGLGEMLKGFRDFPQSKDIRLYYAVTLSNLPDNFKKKQEAIDSLTALQKNFTLTSKEASLVQSTLKKVQSSK